MKKLLFSVLAMIVFVQAQAQTDKGNLMVGGSLAFNKGFGESNNYSTFMLNPNVGYFVSDNFVVGAGVELNINGVKDVYNETGYGGNIFTRYYLGHSSVKPFGMVKLSYGGSKYDDKVLGTDFTSSRFGAQVGPGVAFFLNDNVSIDAILVYDFAKVKDVEDSFSSILFGIGFQAFLGGE